MAATSNSASQEYISCLLEGKIEQHLPPLRAFFFSPSAQLLKELQVIIAETSEKTAKKTKGKLLKDKMDADIQKFIQNDHADTKTRRKAEYFASVQSEPNGTNSSVPKPEQNKISAELSKDKRNLYSACHKKLFESLLQLVPDMRYRKSALFSTPIEFIDNVTDSVQRYAPLPLPTVPTAPAGASPLNQVTPHQTPNNIVLPTSEVTPFGLQTDILPRSMAELPASNDLTPHEKRQHAIETKKSMIRAALKYVQNKLRVEEVTGDANGQLSQLLIDKGKKAFDKLMNWVTLLDDSHGGQYTPGNDELCSLRSKSPKEIIDIFETKIADFEDDIYKRKKAALTKRLNFVADFFPIEEKKKVGSRIRAACSDAKKKYGWEIWNDMNSWLVDKLIMANANSY